MEIKPHSLHFNVKLEGAELQRGLPDGAEDEPEAEPKKLQVRAVPEMHAVCAS